MATNDHRHRRLLDIVPAGMSLTDSFALADEVLRQGIVGLTDLVTKPGLVNVDFADVRVLQNLPRPLHSPGHTHGSTFASC